MGGLALAPGDQRAPRRGASTACPGRYLYAKVPTIRSLADADQHAWTERGRRTDIAGCSWPDLVVRDKATKQAYVVQTGGQVGFAGPAHPATGMSGKDLVVAVRDLNGDGKADVLVRDKATKETSVLPGDGAGQPRRLDPGLHAVPQPRPCSPASAT